MNTNKKMTLKKNGISSPEDAIIQTERNQTILVESKPT
jgi:hypothetical protein